MPVVARTLLLACAVLVADSRPQSRLGQDPARPSRPQANGLFESPQDERKPPGRDPDRPTDTGLITEPSRHFNRSGLFSVVLPARWRQLTPDEARALKKADAAGFADDLLDPKPAEYYAYGEIDRWLADNRFSGGCLSIIVSRGEPEPGDESVQHIRDFAAAYTAGTYEIAECRWTKLGPDAHAAIESRSRRQDRGRPPMRLLEFFVPTGGQTIVLAFRAAEDDFADLLPAFEEAAATLRFSRPPRGSGGLGNNILYAAGIGALVGVLLMILRRRNTA